MVKTNFSKLQIKIIYYIKIINIIFLKINNEYK